MTRFMYDSITAADIPPVAKMVAGYVDGKDKWTAADWARFPGAVKVRIAVFATTNDGHVLDVENGDATPDQIPAWVRMRLAAGQYPSIYCNRSNLNAVLGVVNMAGLHDKVGLWLADWDGNPHLVPGTYATQYANPLYTHQHYDLSEVADYWPGIDALPQPTLPGAGPNGGGGIAGLITRFLDWLRRLFGFTQ